MKIPIRAALGEKRLSRALNAGLAAINRVKYAFSLLQLALEHAENPEQPDTILEPERLACGKGIQTWTLPSPTRKEGKACRIPGGGGILARISDDMLALDSNTEVHAGLLLVKTEPPDGAFETVASWQTAAAA